MHYSKEMIVGNSHNEKTGRKIYKEKYKCPRGEEESDPCFHQLPFELCKFSLKIQSPVKKVFFARGNGLRKCSRRGGKKWDYRAP